MPLYIKHGLQLLALPLREVRDIFKSVRKQ